MRMAAQCCCWVRAAARRRRRGRSVAVGSGWGAPRVWHGQPLRRSNCQHAHAYYTAVTKMHSPARAASAQQSCCMYQSPHQSTLSQHHSTRLDAFDLLLRPQQLVLQVLLLLLDVLLLPVKKAALLSRIYSKRSAQQRAQQGSARWPPARGFALVCQAPPLTWISRNSSCRCSVFSLEYRSSELPLLQQNGDGARSGQQRRRRHGGGQQGRGRGLRGCGHPRAMDRGCWGLGAAAGPPFSLPGDHSRLVSATSIASAFCGRTGTSRAACTAAAALILRAGCPPRPLPRSSRCLRRCPGR